jgi:Bardet-Biedl syndrome 4 protein
LYVCPLSNSLSVTRPICVCVCRECRGQCEYAVYVKALIRRAQGRVDESLQLFQAACVLNPANCDNLKQVGRSLYLRGKYKEALEVFDAAQERNQVYECRVGLPCLRTHVHSHTITHTHSQDVEDWELHHNRGLCYLHIKEFDEALDAFGLANAIQRHDATYVQLGKVHTLMNEFKEVSECE